MPKSATFEIDGIGHVLFESSKRAKHVSISVRPFQGVRVAVPYGVSFSRASRYVTAKISWIQKHQKKMEDLEKRYIVLSGSTNCSTNCCNSTDDCNKLIERLDELSKYHGLPYNRVYIRSQKTRWGSCSAKKNISLNIKLVLLPDALIDYVILHELTHTRILNHGSDFWRILDGFVGNAKALRKELKKYYC